jgi:hypothetical protein
MHCPAHAINRELVRRRIVHDASFAHVFPARFKLRFNQDDHLQ